MTSSCFQISPNEKLRASNYGHGALGPKSEASGGLISIYYDGEEIMQIEDVSDAEFDEIGLVLSKVKAKKAPSLFNPSKN